MYPSSYPHQVRGWKSLQNHETVNGDKQQLLHTDETIASYDLNHTTSTRLESFNKQNPNFNNQIYAYPYASNIVGLSSDSCLQSQNFIFNDYALPLHQLNPFSLRQEVVGDSGRWDGILSTASPVDSSASVNVKTPGKCEKRITVLPFKEPVSSHLPISPSPTITNQDVNFNQIHNLVKLETISPESFPQLIKQTSQGFHCQLSACTFPHKTFPSAEAVIDHIHTEDIPRCKPHAVWCSCNKWFSSKGVGQRHATGENEGKQYKCPIAKCTLRFKRKDQMKRHERDGHPKTPKRRKARNVVQDDE